MKKKTVQKKVQKKKLYLEFDEFSEGGEICEGREGMSYPSYEDTYITFNPKYLHRTEDHCPRFVKEIIEVEDEIYNEKKSNFSHSKIL